MSNEVLPPAARSFLEEARFAVLATIRADGAPQQTVMWYDLKDDEILMNTAAERLKARNIQRDSRISICVADGYRFVTLTGRAVLIDDQTVAQADIAQLAYRYHGPNATGAIEEFRRQRRVTILMPIEHAYVRGF